MESLSQYVWVRALKQLTAANCRNAFEKILTDDSVARGIRGSIRRVVTDNGVEFRGAFDSFLKDQKIEHAFTNRGSVNKACFAELAIKHIKAILGRATADNRTNILGKIQNAVFAMNNASHSATRPKGISASDLLIPAGHRTRPGAPSQKCSELIDDTILHYRRYQHDRNISAEVKGQHQKFHVNDRVRIAIRNDDAFSKISDPQWSSESYTVTSVVQTTPILSYRLALITPDKVKLLLPGSFSETNLKRDLSQ